MTEVVPAFSAEQVVRLTGLTPRQLAYWDHTGFFRPESAEGLATRRGRIYSFRDLVGLRTLAILRLQHGVSLQHLRQVAEQLARYSGRPWSDLKLMVANRRVVFVEPETGRPREVVHGQYVLLPIVEVVEDLTREVAALRQRDPQQIGQVERRRQVSGSAPVVAGTRIRVETVRRFLEDGFSAEDILKEYPSLTLEDVRMIERLGKHLAA